MKNWMKDIEVEALVPTFKHSGFTHHYKELCFLQPRNQ
jgi:hypothetical protein